jgi:hypothetical protein
LMIALMIIAALAAVPASKPSPVILKANVEKLVSFGTRHTLSSPTDPKRGIGAARAWAAAQFETLGKACSGCIAVDLPERRFEGPRAPNGVNIVNVMGIQKGTGDPNDVVIVAGHIDSRVTDIMNSASDAPGANDDGSGTALVLETARILSKEKHRATFVYAILSGEEQGLFGGRLLAETAKARGWNVLAMLNNDIVGNSKGQDGRIVADRVRVFSEGIRFSEGEGAQRERRGNGGEDDGLSRALAKAVARIAPKAATGLTPFLVRRPDRFSRGGDHLPMLEAGYPAIRFSVGVENYDAQHQDVRTEGKRVYGDTAQRMDFAYLAKVTALNIAVMRELADAPSSPKWVTAAGAVATDTVISWDEVAGAAGYRIRWRRADSSDWQFSRDVKNGAAVTLKGVIIDDHFVGVSSLSATGQESVVTFGGAAPRP